MTLFKL